MRKAPVVLTSLGVVVGLVVAVLLFRGYGGGSLGVSAGLRSYSVVSDEQVRIVLEVHKAASATALCTVRARSRDGDEAGNAIVRVGPSRAGTAVVTYDLLTSARAVSGELVGCGLDRSAGTPASG